MRYRKMTPDELAAIQRRRRRDFLDRLRNPEAFLLQTEAAELAGVRPESIRLAIKRGELKSYCNLCRGGLSPERTHHCPRLTPDEQMRRSAYAAYIKVRDAYGYSPNPWQQANGRRRAALAKVNHVDLGPIPTLNSQHEGSALSAQGREKARSDAENDLQSDQAGSVAMRNRQRATAKNSKGRSPKIRRERNVSAKRKKQQAPKAQRRRRESAPQIAPAPQEKVGEGTRIADPIPSPPASMIGAAQPQPPAAA